MYALLMKIREILRSKYVIQTNQILYNFQKAIHIYLLMVYFLITLIRFYSSLISTCLFLWMICFFLRIFILRTIQKILCSIFQIIVNKQILQNISMSQTNGTIRIGTFLVDLNQVLGKGATGYVYRGYHVESFQPVAVKAIQMSQVNNEVTQYLLEGEKRAMLTIKSPYVVKTIDIIQQRDYCYIIMEVCSNGTLKDYIQKKGKLSSEEAIELFKKIVIGYIAIVDSLFIHRDMKTANILLRENGDPVIIDFGYCQMIMGKRPMIQYNVGSPSYMSPQAHSKSRYSQKSDIWSLGAIFHEMLTGNTLDNGINIKEFFKIIEAQGKVRINKLGMSQLSIQLLDISLQFDPEKRATVHKLKYLIDKSMIPHMQAQLKKTHSQTSKNSSQGQLKFVPSTHFNFIQSSKSPITIAEKKEKIIEHLKLLKGTDQLHRNHEGHFHSRDIEHQMNSVSQNSFNSAQDRNQNSVMQIPTHITQNIPPQPHSILRKSLQRNNIPERVVRKLTSVKQIDLKPSFKKIPILQKAHSYNETGAPSPNRYGVVSLRII